MQLIIVFLIALLSWSAPGYAAQAGTMDYDTSIHRYKFYNGTSWVNMGVTIGLIPCSNEGQIEYDGLLPALKFCNGTVWRSFLVTLTLNACSKAGEWHYNASVNRYQFCNGLLWSYMG